MAIGLEDRQGGLTQAVVELARPVRQAGQRLPDGQAHRRLSVAHHSGDRHADAGGDLAHEHRQIGAGSREQASGQQHLPRQAVAQHPQDLVPDIRLQPVQSQDHAALPGHNGAQPVMVGERGRNEFVPPVGLRPPEGRLRGRADG